jgi:peptidoglycan/LPS O-acetylase OafA/YrhL
VSESAIDPRFANRERQPGLDLLRALAIIAVVIYHAGIFGFALSYDLHRFGWVGVDLFFVLSGYLIGGQLLVPLARGQKINFRRFYARRALRIMPAYFVILAVYFSLPSWREFPEISPLWKFLISAQNIDLRGGTAFSHAWSLAIEDQFYLLLPLVLLFVSRGRRAAVVVPCAVLLGGMALRAFLAYLHPGDAGVSERAFQKWIYYPTWTRLDPLVLGVVLAAIEKFRPEVSAQRVRDQSPARFFRFFFHDVLRTDVRGHDDHRVLEIDRSPLPVCDPSIIEHLQQHIEYFRIRFFDFVEEHH